MQGYTEHTPSSSLHLWGGTRNLWQDVTWNDVGDKCCVTQKHPLLGVASGGWYRYQTLSAGNSFALPQTVESLGLFKMTRRVSVTRHVFLRRSSCQNIVNA